MGISKSNWRFSNITPDFTDTCEQVEQALAKGIAWANQHRAWADFIETTWGGAR